MSEPVKELDEVDGVVKIVEKGPVPLVKLKKDKGKKKTEPEIKHEVEGGEVKFLCDKCSYKGPTTTSVKMHLAKKHRGEKRDRVADDDEDIDITKKSKSEEDKANDTMESIGSGEDDDSEDDDDDFLNKYDEDGNLIDVAEEEPMDTEKSLEVAQENTETEDKFLKDEIAIKNAKIETLEDAMQVKEELLHLANAKVATLEIDIIEKDRQVEKYKKIAKKAKKDDPEDLKKSKKEVTAKSKEIEDLKTKLAEALKKTRDEITMRAKAEADVISKQQTIDVMKEIMMQQSSLSTNKEPQQQVVENRKNQLCRDSMKPEGCRWGKGCMFFHPPGSTPTSAQSGEKLDCSFWLAGYCKYSESECRGKHEASKRGAKPRKMNQQKPAETNIPDFAQTLARAVSQGLAGAQPQPPSMGQHGLPQQMMQQQQMFPQMMMMPANPAMFFPQMQGGQGGARQ